MHRNATCKIQKYWYHRAISSMLFNNYKLESTIKIYQTLLLTHTSLLLWDVGHKKYHYKTKTALHSKALRLTLSILTCKWDCYSYQNLQPNSRTARLYGNNLQILHNFTKRTLWGYWFTSQCISKVLIHVLRTCCFVVLKCVMVHVNFVLKVPLVCLQFYIW